MASPEEGVNDSLKQKVAALKKLGKAVTDDKAKAAVLRNASDLQEAVQKLVAEEATLAKLRDAIKSMDAEVTKVTAVLEVAQARLTAAKQNRDASASLEKSSLQKCADLLKMAQTQNATLNKAIQPYRASASSDPASKTIGELAKDTTKVSVLQPAK